MQWIGIAVGCFYVFAGAVLLHAMRMDRFLDSALAQLTLEPTPVAERVRGRMSAVIAWTTLLGGAALAILSVWAVPLFLVSALAQAGFLVWARRNDPPENEGEAAGRRRTVNAFVIYLVACALVLWLLRDGVLVSRPVAELGTLAAVGVFVVAERVVSAIRAKRAPWREPEEERPEEAYEREPPGEPGLRLSPSYECWPLWDNVTGDNLDPREMGLPPELVERIERWDAEFQALFVGDDWTNMDFPTDEARLAYTREFEEIARALEEAGEQNVIRMIPYVAYRPDLDGRATD